MARSTTPKTTGKAKARPKSATPAATTTAEPKPGTKVKPKTVAEQVPARGRTTSAAPAVTAAEREEQVRRRAYERFVERHGDGRAGTPVDDWLEAERELGLHAEAMGQLEHDGHDGRQPWEDGSSGRPLVNEAWLTRPRLDESARSASDGGLS